MKLPWNKNKDNRNESGDGFIGQNDTNIGSQPAGQPSWEWADRKMAQACRRQHSNGWSWNNTEQDGYGQETGRYYYKVYSKSGDYIGLHYVDKNGDVYAYQEG